MRKIIGGLAMVLLAASAPAAGRDGMFAFEDPALDAVTSPELVRFGGERDFTAYLKALQRIEKRRKDRWITARWRSVQLAAQQVEQPCIPEVDCPEEEASDGSDSIVVTGSKVSSPSITNNQTVGVDEGDIVKQIGPYLLVLQDGRIFSIDTRGGLRLADRMNVYRDPNSGAWYDEMLVQDDRVIIAAYSYQEDATELSVFAIDRATGRLRRDGVFLISSDDYYSTDNYATRIVGDRLVIYTPYETDQLRERGKRPVVRRWLPEAERGRAGREAAGRPLIDARDIFRPVQRTSEPTVHTISVCPLGDREEGADLRCRTTGFIAPERAEMFVSTEDVFLWTWPGGEETGWGWRREDCATAARAARRDVLPGAVFRMNVRSGAASVLGVAGSPFDQFSMDSRGGEFRALVDWRPFRCDRPREQGAEVAFLKAPHRLFGSRLDEVADARITALPSPAKRMVENRFADDWLVYGGRDRWSMHPPDKEDGPQTTRAVAVPVADPARARVIELPHNIVRTERVGGDMVLNGYRDASGLYVTLLELGREPRVASRLHMAGRFESEGRSHAFNSIVGADGNGMIGVPTIKRKEEADGWWWRSDASDLSFLTLSSARALASAGELRVISPKPDASYSCEVSCIDWYGNSRPIFTDRRVFGLLGTELVEARLDADRIVEARRLDLTKPVRTAGAEPSGGQAR